MKPSIQNIINKLPKEKVDLATQKVDLAVVDDVANMVQEGQASLRRLKQLMKDQDKLDRDLINAVKKVVTDGDKRASKLDGEVKQLERADIEIAGVLDRADRAARDLGVSSNSIKDYSKLEKLYNDVEAAIKDAQSFLYSDLSQYARN